MSVKRYDFDCYAFYDSARLTVQECDDGDYVLHSDYAALLARHNALREAVKKMLHIDTPENFEGGSYLKARAEVDRLLGGGGRMKETTTDKICGGGE